MQHNTLSMTIEKYDTRHYETQRNDIRHIGWVSLCWLLFMRTHDIKHNETHHNDIHHNDTQHKSLICDTQHKWHWAKMILSTTMLSILLSVILLNVAFYLLLCWIYAESHYVECHYAECRGAICHVSQESILRWVSLCWMSLSGASWRLYNLDPWAYIKKLINSIIYGFCNTLECLSLNTILGWRGLPGTNTLAYYGNCKLRP